MTTIDAIHAHLDQFPDDHSARLALADALIESEDERGLGFRALRVNGIRPVEWYNTVEPLGQQWLYHNGNGNCNGVLFGTVGVLPACWIYAMIGRTPALVMECDLGLGITERMTRRFLEEAAAAAFLKLPKKTQNNYLKGTLWTTPNSPYDSVLGTRRNSARVSTSSGPC